MLNSSIYYCCCEELDDREIIIKYILYKCDCISTFFNDSPCCFVGVQSLTLAVVCDLFESLADYFQVAGLPIDSP